MLIWLASCAHKAMGFVTARKNRQTSWRQRSSFAPVRTVGYAVAAQSAAGALDRVWFHAVIPYTASRLYRSLYCCALASQEKSRVMPSNWRVRQAALSP